MTVIYKSISPVTPKVPPVESPPQDTTVCTRTRPQVHSMRHHCTYTGTTSLPSAVSIGHGSSNDSYEVVLFYPRNRACTLHRCADDFRILSDSLQSNSAMPRLPRVPCHPTLVTLETILAVALSAEVPQTAALEYFLRRRMGDCWGQ